MRTSTINALVRDLAGAGEISTDDDVLEAYRRDQAAPRFLDAGTPAVLVRPRTTGEVQAAVRAAASHRVPIVARGAGSGLSGGANAIDGCIVLSLERMDSILDIDSRSLTATVQPGVINDALRRAALAHGLWYAPDPASMEFSTIGGNVATNAGGLCCVKYGVTRDALLEIEVVLADGRCARFGRRTRKGVAGYDLAGLMCGSEGTLGIITEVTVRLLPPPAPAATLAASFPHLRGAGEAIMQIVTTLQPSLLELVDRATMDAVESFKPMNLDRDAAALLFARSDAGTLASQRQIERMAQWCDQAGATLTVTSDEEAEGRMLMAARRLAYTALEHQGSTLLDDVAVPLGRIGDLVEGIEAIAIEQQVRIATFGHAGDGNMHPTLVYDHRDPHARERVRLAFEAIVRLARSLGGTVTGEHGVGLLKRGFLSEELGDALDVHHAIKAVFDPQNILNPGKAI